MGMNNNIGFYFVNIIKPLCSTMLVKSTHVQSQDQAVLHRLRKLLVTIS